MSKKLNPFLGKTGIAFHKVKTSDTLFNETQTYTDKLIELIKDKVLPNVKISDDALNELREFIQVHIVSIISKLMKAENIEAAGRETKKDAKEISAITPQATEVGISREYSVTIEEDSAVEGTPEFNKFNLMLNLHLDDIFAIPFLISFMAMKDRQKATEITVAEFREIQNELDRYIKFQRKISRETDPRKLLMIEILEVRNELIKKNNKIPLMKDIAAIVRPDKHKNTLNSEIKTLGLEFDYKTGKFYDRKTNAEISLPESN